MSTLSNKAKSSVKWIKKKKELIITAGQTEQGKNTHQKKKGHRSYYRYTSYIKTLLDEHYLTFQQRCICQDFFIFLWLTDSHTEAEDSFFIVRSLLCKLWTQKLPICIFCTLFLHVDVCVQAIKVGYLAFNFFFFKLSPNVAVFFASIFSLLLGPK